MAYPLALLWPGATREPYAKLAQEKYLTLLGRYAKVEIRELAAPRGVANGPPGRYISAEDQRLAAAVRPGEQLLLLDPAGREYDSIALSRRLGAIFLSSRRPVFAICGPHGAGPLMGKRADERLSLSRLTLAHDLARVVLFEQIYRALDLLRGGPYHK